MYGDEVGNSSAVELEDEEVVCEYREEESKGIIEEVLDKGEDVMKPLEMVDENTPSTVDDRVEYVALVTEPVLVR